MIDLSAVPAKEEEVEEEVEEKDKKKLASAVT